MSLNRPVILVSNDDGVHASGIAALASALESLGDVYVVAPDTEQSARSHAITLTRPLRLRSVRERVFSVDGTPADSVYVALHHRDLLPLRPSLVVSGVNHGLNMGSDVFYSGTIAAAREAALRGIDSLAVSTPGDGDVSLAAKIALDVAAKLLRQALTRAASQPASLWNLNVPRGPEILGVKITRQGERIYDEMVEVRADPRGRPYLWIGGPTVRHPTLEGADTTAFDQGWASLTPLTIDATHGQEIGAMEQLFAQK
ncbi:MAG: 5'/3'-nucleotidase SurE [Deltaproteobacteria bacterium]|nr:5'/3'-nucleotidase SurE [Deltaproteobacteria bacterium]